MSDLALELAEAAAAYAPASPADCDMAQCNFRVLHGVRGGRLINMRTNRCFLPFLERMREMRENDQCKFYYNPSSDPNHFIAPVLFRQPPNSTASLQRVLALVFLEYKGLPDHELNHQLAYDRLQVAGQPEDRYVVMPGNRDGTDLRMENCYPMESEHAKLFANFDLHEEYIEHFIHKSMTEIVAEAADEQEEVPFNNQADPAEQDALDALQLMPQAQPNFALPAAPAAADRHAMVTRLRARLEDINVPGRPGKRPRAEAQAGTSGYSRYI